MGGWKWKHCRVSTLLLLFLIGSIKCIELDKMDEWETKVVKVLHWHASKVNFDKFFGDRVVTQIQKSDEDGNILQIDYVHRRSDKVYFTSRDASDYGKDSILIGSNFNKFAIPTPRGSRKRQFILLKKSMIQKDPKVVDYHMTFVYLRDLIANETYFEFLEIQNLTVVPEYDLWEFRRTEFLYGWHDCQFTALFICPTVKTRRRRSKREIDFWSGHHIVKRQTDEEPIPFKVPEKYNIDDLRDLYHDFDFFGTENSDMELTDEQKKILDMKENVLDDKTKKRHEDKIKQDEAEIAEREKKKEEELQKKEEEDKWDRKIRNKRSENEGQHNDNEEENRKLVDRVLKFTNKSDMMAYLYLPAKGVPPIPGISSLLVVASDDDDAHSILGDGKKNGVLILDAKAPMPDILLKVAVAPAKPPDDGRKVGNQEDEVEGGIEVDEVYDPNQSRKSVWDVVKYGIIEVSVPWLVEAGLSPEEARLSALGSQITGKAPSLIPEAHYLGWRIGTETFGTGLNGGPYRRKGFKGNESIPSNDAASFGTLHQGAGLYGKMFMLQRLSTTKVQFVNDDEAVNGHFVPGVPGTPDGFFPEDEAELENIVNTKGRIIPLGFDDKGKNLGITGHIRKGNRFFGELVKINGYYDPSVPEWHVPAERVWIPETNDKVKRRPANTSDGRTVVYGTVFPGMIESPHVFVADGDSISGFFVPNDKRYPISGVEAIHGVLTPIYPAGHAVFVADNLDEVENVNEIRGAFTPDAMGYQGGLSGVISEMDNWVPGRYMLKLDRPGVEFMFIEDYPDTEHVWTNLYKPGRWKWKMPALDETDPVKENEKKSLEIPEDDPSIEKYQNYYGIKISTRRTDVFLPYEFATSGTLILVPLNNTIEMRTFDADVYAKRPTEPMIAVLRNSRGEPELKRKAVADYDESTAIFIPYRFPPFDAIVCTYHTYDSTLRIMQAAKSHFWHKGQDIWVPVGFRQMLINKMKKGGADELKAKDQAYESEGKRGVPGVLLKQARPPKKAPNYKFGSLYDPDAEEMKEDYLKTGPPHEFIFGFYLLGNSSTSREPVFIPDTGIAGLFTPEKDKFPPETVYFFPERGNFKAKFVFKKGTVAEKGQQGKWRPAYKKPGHGYLPVYYDGKELVISGTVDTIPGWRQVEVPRLKPDMFPSEARLEEKRFKKMKRRLKYALIDIGGGFRGVVVQGADAIDDPNNPIFQQFIHYKAHRDGDVNPWGEMNIVDPIIREDMPENEKVKKSERGAFGGITRIGKGRFLDDVFVEGKMAYNVMKQFSMRYWEYKKISEITNDLTREALKLGQKGNVVNMMDFRMFLFRKFTLKRARYDKIWTRVYVPWEAEALLIIRKRGEPSKEWLEFSKKSGPLALAEKAFVVNFAVHFQLDVQEIIAFRRPAGDAPPILSAKAKQILNADRYQEWGDEDICDEIWLEPLQTAQLTTAISKGDAVLGVDLGYSMTLGYGFDMKFSTMAKILLNLLEKKRLEHVKEKLGKGKQSNEEDELQNQLALLPGWRTQHKTIAPGLNATLMDDNRGMFYGLGSCKQDEPPNLGLWDSGSPADVLQFFIQFMRVDCLDSVRGRLIKMINDGYLDFDPQTKFFRIPSTLSPLRSLKSSRHDLQWLSLAYELHALTRTYFTVLQKGYLKTPVLVEPFCNISRSVGFITEMTLYVVTRAPLIVPGHTARMIRNWLATLRTIMSRLYEDGEILEKECDDPSCDFEKMVNRGDQFRITSLIHFIINGLGQYEKGEALLRPAFKTFVRLNHDAIKQRVIQFARVYKRNQFPASR